MVNDGYTKLYNDNDFLSVKEFAAFINVHPNTVRRAIKSGKLNAFRIGKGSKAVYRIPKMETNRLAIMNLEEIVGAVVEKRLQENPKCL